MEKFIVKVQIAFNTELPRAFIYNEDKSVMWEGEVDNRLANGVGPDRKKFYYAHIHFGRLMVGEEAPWQDW